jgi:hypothetical protein
MTKIAAIAAATRITLCNGFMCTTLTSLERCFFLKSESAFSTSKSGASSDPETSSIFWYDAYSADALKAANSSAERSLLSHFAK